MIIHRFSRRSSAASRYASGSIHKTYLYIKLICNPRVKPIGYTLILSISGFMDKPYVHAMVATSRTFFTHARAGATTCRRVRQEKKKKGRRALASPLRSRACANFLILWDLASRGDWWVRRVRRNVILWWNQTAFGICSAVQRNMNGPETRQVVIPGLVC